MIAEPPGPRPDDYAGLAAALVAAGAPIHRARSMALHTVTVLWPLFEAARRVR